MFGPFDFDENGKEDDLEFMFGMSILEEMEEKEQRDEIEAAGLNLNELECMDEWERREAIENAGLDPDDYDF